MSIQEAMVFAIGLAVLFSPPATIGPYLALTKVYDEATQKKYEGATPAEIQAAALEGLTAAQEANTAAGAAAMMAPPMMDILPWSTSPRRMAKPP